MAHEVRPPSESRGPGDARSLGELFSELSTETSELIRREVDLAKTEVTHNVTRMGKDVGFLVGAGLIAYAGLLALIATLILALGQLIPALRWWWAALIITLIVFAAAGGLAMKGMNDLKRARLAPKQTIETLKEDAEWVKHPTS